MKLLPINLNLEGSRVLIAGGGVLALRKARQMKAFGARVTAVSPCFTPAFRKIGGVKKILRIYRSGDLRGIKAVIAATNSGPVNRKIWKDASRRGIPINVVDDPAICTFTLPAIMRRGKLVIAVSTGGSSPAFSGYLRRKLEKVIDRSCTMHLSLVENFRKKVLRSSLMPAARRRLLMTAASDPIGKTLRRKGGRYTRRILYDMLKKEVVKKTQRSRGSE